MRGRRAMFKNGAMAASGASAVPRWGDAAHSRAKRSAPRCTASSSAGGLASSCTGAGPWGVMR